MRYAPVVLVVLGSLSSFSYSAVIRDDADARIDVSYGEDGVRFGGIAFRDAVPDLDAVKRGMAAWFGTDVDKITVVDTSEEEALLLGVRGHLEREPPFRYSDSLNWDALRTALETTSVSSVQIVGFVPPSPGVKFGDFWGANLLGVQRYEEVRTLSQIAGVSTVQYGWGYGHLILYGATPIIFLVGFELVLRTVRKRALAVTGPDQPAAIFRCGKIHHTATLLFLVLWPGLIVMLVPMGYVLYVPKAFYGTALAARVFVPILVAFAYVVWMRVALYPVFQQFPEPNWSRKQLGLQGVVLGLLSLMLVPAFGLSVGMLVIRPEIDVDFYLPVIFLPVAILLAVFLVYSGIVWQRVRSFGNGSVRERIKSLAQWIGVKKIPSLKLLDYPDTGLARALEGYFSFNAYRARLEWGNFLTARSLRALQPEELDAILLTKLDRSARRAWMYVNAVRVLRKALIFPVSPFAGVVVLALIGESAGVRYLYNGWVLFGTVYGLPAAILFIGGMLESRLAHLAARETDGRVQDLMGDPEVHIRGILREARANYVPLDLPRWLRSLNPPTPLVRVHYLAERGGIADARVIALQEEVDDTFDADSGSSQLEDGAVVEWLGGRLNYHRLGFLLGLIVLPLLSPWIYRQFFDELVPLWVVLSLGSVACTVIVLGLENFLWPLGLRDLAKTLPSRILLPDAPTTRPVLAEGARVQRLFGTKGMKERSVGFLFGSGGSICYRSEDSERIMRADEINEISMHLECGPLFPIVEIRIAWEDRATKRLNRHQYQLLHPTTGNRNNFLTVTKFDDLWRYWQRELRKPIDQTESELAAARARLVRTKEAGLFLVSLSLLCAGTALFGGWKDGLPMNWSAPNSAFITPAVVVGICGLCVLFQQGYVRWLLRKCRKAGCSPPEQTSESGE